MAGNANSGTSLAFKLTEKELTTAIREYKESVKDGTIPRASWPHFCAELGYTEAEVAEVIQRKDNRDSAYYNRAVALNRMLTWVRGQLASGTGWGGTNQTRASLLLQQDYGDGVRYSSGQQSQAAKAGPNIILFGGGDKRGRNAGK